MNCIHKELKSVLLLNGTTAPLPQLPPLGEEEADIDEELTATMRCNNLQCIVKAIRQKNVHKMRQQGTLHSITLTSKLRDKGRSRLVV